MFETLISLIVLFTVIIDPPLSFIFFITNTKTLSKEEKISTALQASFFAFIIAFTVLILGKTILDIFSVKLDHFQVAGGVILLILGIKMTLGLTFKNNIETGDSSDKDLLSTIIATPLISGPACITTIMLASVQHGRLMTGIALFTVLLLTTGLLLIACIFNIKKIGASSIKMITTVLGLITLSMGISFILNGLGV